MLNRGSLELHQHGDLVMNIEALATIIEDLIVALQVQARQLEKLITEVEQVTVHMPEKREMAVIQSSLSELHLRIKKLQTEATTIAV